METLALVQIVATVMSLITGVLAENGNVHLVKCIASDREVLIDFKSGLSDPRNLLSSWKGSNCCQWWGISCNNRTGAVIIADIHNVDQNPESYGLGGEIRASLAKLESLEYLDLSFNSFIGNRIPTFLQSLKRLQYLNLANAGFSGKIPPNLGNISTLQYLDMSSYRLIGDVEWVTSLTSLKYLALNNVDLSMVRSDWIGALNMLPHLREVHFSYCNLQNSSLFLSFANFSSLSVVDLSYNGLESFPIWLGNISGLVSVDLSFNNMWGIIPRGLSELPNLQFLKLTGNNLQDSSYQLFKGSWEKVKVIQLNYNNIHGKLPASIGNMTSLAHLALSGNYIQGDFPSSFGKLCNLKYLDLSANNLTGSLPEDLDRPKNCLHKNLLPHLQKLVLSVNQLTGELPNWFGQLQNLVELRLDNNLFHGSVPAVLRALRHLTVLKLEENRLNGTLPGCLGEISKLSVLDVSSNNITGSLPDSLGQLSELSVLDVSSNLLTGIVSESHFSNLKKLKILSLSWNSFVFNFSSNWIPPFQVKSLMMHSCHLNSLFPGWLKSQKHIVELDLSNANISGTIPSWFWNISGKLTSLNFSSNRLEGQLPTTFEVAFNAFVDFSFNHLEGPIPLPTNQIVILNLSNNRFSGPIPENIGVMSFLSFLSLASNQIIGEIPKSVGEMLVLRVIDFSRNNLTGSIPDSIQNCIYLEVLDLQNNNISGIIPHSLGQATYLQTMHLRNNMITGKIPLSLKGLSRLETLDLGYNRLTGKIPQWLGAAFPHLKILSLRSNAFSGEIPTALLSLRSLKVMDLAENKLRGMLPTKLDKLKAMSQEHSNYQDLSYGLVAGIYYEENIVVNTKGSELYYTRTLSFLTCIDVSGNHLHGELPLEVTNLAGLVVLNFSRNQITGQVPLNISELRQLASLDLSSNMLSGPIPPSMVSMSFLEYLNMSYNNLSGKIPYSGQMATFEASSFAGNPELCGVPLLAKCSGYDPPIPIIGENDSGDVYFGDKWLYLAIGLGFASGIVVPYLIFATNRTWSFAYFAFVDKTVDAILYFGCKTAACFRSH